MKAACIIVVNLFEIISGYFMVEGKIKLRKVITIGIGGVGIYSVLFTMLSEYNSGVLVLYSC